MQTKNELIKVFTDINNPKDMEKLFSEILTEKERKDIILRWRLLKMLKEGIPQRKIAQELSISLCKITRGAKILKDKKSVIKSILEA